MFDFFSICTNIPQCKLKSVIGELTSFYFRSGEKNSLELPGMVKVVIAYLLDHCLYTLGSAPVFVNWLKSFWGLNPFHFMGISFFETKNGTPKMLKQFRIFLVLETFPPLVIMNLKTIKIIFILMCWNSRGKMKIRLKPCFWLFH